MRRTFPVVPVLLVSMCLSACPEETASNPDVVADAVDTGEGDGAATPDAAGTPDGVVTPDPGPTPDAVVTPDPGTTPDAVPDAGVDAPAVPDATPDAEPDGTGPDATPDVPASTGDWEDDFAGTGPLMGYTTNNPDSLPVVGRVDGRYRAELTDNTDNITLHFNNDQGRLDAKLLTFPFDVVARNIGIGTLDDSQVAPPGNGNPYIFAGVQVHVTDLDDRNSSHVVVGHRGGTHFTVEGKHTVDGDSSVNDDGANIVLDGRADIRIVGNADRTITVYWQVPNLDPGVQADAWSLYRGTGDLPPPHPTYGDQVYVGLITYAYQYGGIPFVGTCDGLEGGSF